MTIQIHFEIIIGGSTHFQIWQKSSKTETKHD